MRINSDLTDGAVLQELGSRLARLRLQRNLPQSQLADEAGVNRKAVVRVEAGEPVQLVTLVRILRALGRLDALDAAVPELEPSPIELLESRQGVRRRARRSSSGEGRRGGSGWRWADER